MVFEKLKIEINRKRADLKTRKVNDKLYQEYSKIHGGLSSKELEILKRKKIHPITYIDFGMNIDNIDDYLLPNNYKKLHPLNNAFSTLIDNKGFLPAYLENIPKLNLVFIKGNLRINTLESLPILNWDKIFNHTTEFIYKPLGQSGGEGIFTLNKNDIKNVITEKIKSKQSFIIQERIIQASYASEVFSDSLNTMRIVVYRDVESHLMKVLVALHRFGTYSSAPVDNTGAGGIKANIDIETGKLSQGYISPGWPNSGYNNIHPNTKFQMEGFQIPNWHQNIKNILNELNQLQWLEYGGLDIVFTKDGYKIIEINSFPDIKSQIYKPYLKDESFVKFLKSKGFKKLI